MRLKQMARKHTHICKKQEYMVAVAHHDGIHGGALRHQCARAAYVLSIPFSCYEYFVFTFARLPPDRQRKPVLNLKTLEPRCVKAFGLMHISESGGQRRNRTTLITGPPCVNQRSNASLMMHNVERLFVF